MTATKDDGRIDEMARKLDHWRRVRAQRDALVCSAAELGIPVNQIVRRTGLAKTTVLRILAASDAS